jgi:hypothetical protein
MQNALARGRIAVLPIAVLNLGATATESAC